MAITYSSPLLGIAVTFGNLAIWLGLGGAITCVVLYWIAMLRTMRLHPEGSPVLAAEAPAPESNGNGHTNGNGKKDKKNGKLVPFAKAAEPSAAELKTDAVGMWARKMFFFTCGCAILGSLCLWALIFNHQYIVDYIHKNSNNGLPFGYRFASFWSDQEGTFFLWTLYNVVLGTLLIKKARKDERWVMPFFALINVSLFTLLAFMNPFWLRAPKDILTALTAPPFNIDPARIDFLPTSVGANIQYYFGWFHYINLSDGRGLNESLQNFWMVIHPPTLFVGYSSMIIPGCFALGALMRRDYDSWVHRAAPWLMWAWTILATGIFLGAYWAYETLGWGGYWSWDPVENSSLIPWLVGSALLHGLLSQRARGNFKQANLFLGVLVGNAVLLGSFLVRSGVLSEASKHAFATPQKAVFNTLLGVMALWFVMSMAIWLWRYRDIQSETAYDNVWERHFGFFLGLIVLSATAIIVTFGVTMPIWKAWLPGMGGKANVDFLFYNKSLVPVMFVTVLLMTLTPLMPWRGRGGGGGGNGGGGNGGGGNGGGGTGGSGGGGGAVGVGRRPLKPFSQVTLALALGITLFFLFGAFVAWQNGFATPHNDLAFVGMGLMIALGLVTNSVVMARSVRGGWLNAGPWLAHLGFLVMLGGVVISSRFNTVHPIGPVAQGEPVQVAGHTFTWAGERKAADDKDKDRMLIDMSYGGAVTHLDPKFFESKQGDEPHMMAWPQITHEWFGGVLGDVYVEPNKIDKMSAAVVQDLKKGDPDPKEATVQRRKSDPAEPVSVVFEDLDMAQVQKAIKSGDTKDEIAYGVLKVTINGVEQKVRAGARMSFGGPEGPQADPIPVRIAGLHQGTGYSLIWEPTLTPGNVTAAVAFVPDEAVPQAYFQVLLVPGIQVLWWGCYIMIIGGFMTWRRRVNFARKEKPVEVLDEAEPEAEIPARRAVPTGTPEPVGAE